MKMSRLMGAVALVSLFAANLFNTRPLGLETKDDENVPDNTEVKKAVADMMSAWTEFKSKNEAEQKEFLKKGSSDIVTKETVDKLNETLDKQEQQIKEMRLDAARRSELDRSEGKAPRSADQIEHTKSFQALMRKGTVDDDTYHKLSEKTLSVGSDPDGGYLAPIEVDRAIERIMSQVSPIRQYADVRTISANAFKKPWNNAGTNSGWVGETSDRPQTNTAKLSVMEFPVMELYAEPAATQTLLDDAYVNIEDWIASEVGIEFAEQEGKAFVSGDGINKPKGLLAQNFVADANQVHGKIGYTITGVNGAFKAPSSTVNPADDLIDLTTLPKVGYLPGACFMMNRKTRGATRKFKDQNGLYLWQPSIQAGIPDSLLGYPVAIAEDFPDFTTTDAMAVLFGNLKRGYVIVDRIGIRVLRDPFTAKPYVLFYTTKRVGGGVQNYEAYKTLKFGTS